MTTTTLQLYALLWVIVSVFWFMAAATVASHRGSIWVALLCAFFGTATAGIAAMWIAGL